MNLHEGGPLEPIVVWIGDWPIMHGERDDSEACLCGQPVYFLCPDWPTHGIAGLTIEATDREEPS